MKVLVGQKIEVSVNDVIGKDNKELTIDSDVRIGWGMENKTPGLNICGDFEFSNDNTSIRFIAEDAGAVGQIVIFLEQPGSEGKYFYTENIEVCNSRDLIENVRLGVKIIEN